MNEVSAALNRTRADIAAQWQSYQDQVQIEIQSLADRGAVDDTASREITARVEQLQAKQAVAAARIKQAWQDRSANLRADIDRWKSLVSEADADMRERILGIIERRQVELQELNEQLVK